MNIIIVFTAGIAVLLFLVAYVKANAFIGLIASAATMGLLSGLSPIEVVETINAGFADTVLDIGLVIILGTMLGKFLEKTNSTDRMSVDAINLVGEKRSALAMALSGYVISIPVFSDSALVILSPLVRALSAKTKIPRGVLAVSLCAGLLATNVFFPPTPGPLAAAGLLGIDVGRVMIYGGIVALVYALSGWAYAQIVLAKKPDSFYTYDVLPDKEEHAEVEEKDLPSTFTAFSPLVLPLVLILTNTFCKMVLPEGSPILSVSGFVGMPIVALIFGIALAIILNAKTLGKAEILKLLNDALNEAGSIVFIVSAGGALGYVLKMSGAGPALGEAISKTGLPALLIPYVVAAVIKMVNGSGTTALITTVTICASMLGSLGLDPILVFLSSAAGASICCHVNDSLFWVYARCMGFDTKTALKTLSISNVVESVCAMLATVVISFIV